MVNYEVDLPKGKKIIIDVRTEKNGMERAFRELSKIYDFTDSQDGTKFLLFTMRDTSANISKKFIGTWIELALPIEYVSKSGKKRMVKRRPVVSAWTPDMDLIFSKTEPEFNKNQCIRVPNT